ncbi:hypothetical protein GPL17_36640 [Bradyrhizobium yuanmingense]|uniref:hypothetical protein n=1 Tax=Bradyrhizobium yuanmingense TaxID=108015 RepID=UPI0012F8118C|nr:hypothetical protein [Bradyrhizobium yuanmingense]MVT55913.1 hypothetical protein [Bradyrhizobium yuanmingense]
MKDRIITWMMGGKCTILACIYQLNFMPFAPNFIATGLITRIFLVKAPASFASQIRNIDNASKTAENYRIDLDVLA